MMQGNSPYFVEHTHTGPANPHAFGNWGGPTKTENKHANGTGKTWTLGKNGSRARWAPWFSAQQENTDNKRMKHNNNGKIQHARNKGINRGVGKGCSRESR